MADQTGPTAGVSPSIEELKRYAGLSPDGDASTLELCMRAAMKWFQNAGVLAPVEEENPLYNLGVYQLALHYYDNRGVLDNSGTASGNGGLPFGVLSIMNQLRF